MHRLSPRAIAPQAAGPSPRPAVLAPRLGLPAIFGRDRIELLSGRRAAERLAVTGDELVVRALYRELLGRKPDAEGLKFYLGKLADGATRESIRAEIMASEEYRARQAEAATIPYTTKYPHAVSELASQLGTDADTLMKLNGWSDPAQVVQAGTALRLPDTAATRAAVAELGQPVPATGETPKVETPDVAPPAGEPGTVRHISQRTPQDDDGSYYNGDSNCGPTSAAMILRAFGYRPELMDADLINHLGGLMGTGGNGTGAWNLYNAVENLEGYHASIQEGSNPDWIIQQLEAGNYVVANGNYYGGVNADPNGMYGQGVGDHYVTVAGWDGENFLVHDPWNPGGEPEKYSYEQMRNFLVSNHNHDGYAVAIGKGD